MVNGSAGSAKGLTKPTDRSGILFEENFQVVSYFNRL